MQINTKKIIAREFLLFLSCLTIGILTFSGTYVYNYIKRAQIESLSKEVDNKILLSEKFSKAYTDKTDKQFWYTKQYTSHFNNYGDYPNAKLWKDLYELAKTNKVKSGWENTWKEEFVSLNRHIGFETPESLQAFILENMVYQTDLENKELSEKAYSEAEGARNQISRKSIEILSPKNQLKTAGMATLIAIMVLFVFRYLTYGVKWSLNILRQP